MTEEPDAPHADAVARAVSSWARDLVRRLPETVELSVQVRVSSGLVLLVVALGVLLWA